MNVLLWSSGHMLLDLLLFVMTLMLLPPGPLREWVPVSLLQGKNVMMLIF